MRERWLCEVLSKACRSPPGLQSTIANGACELYRSQQALLFAVSSYNHCQNLKSCQALEPNKL